MGVEGQVTYFTAEDAEIAEKIGHEKAQNVQKNIRKDTKFFEFF
jgi:hypothetical protein